MMNPKIIFLFFHLIILSHSGLGHGSEEIRKPPKFKWQPPNDVLSFVKESNIAIFIPCEAEEHPTNLPHNYRWTKNDKDLNFTTSSESDKQMKYEITDGNEKMFGLFIKDPVSDDAGQYQCFISNALGVAMSNSVILREIKMYPPTNAPKTVHEKDSFNLKCSADSADANPLGYVRTKENFWARKINGQIQRIDENERITLGPDGMLWFSRAEKSDELNEFNNGSYVYEAHIQNSKNLVCKTSLNVLNASSRGARATDQSDLKSQFVSDSNETAIYMENKTLYCVYDGNSLDRIEWKFENLVFNKSNVKEAKSKKSLKITNFTKDNQGNYTCEVYKSGNSTPFVKNTFRVTIGKPYFETQLENKEIPENKNAEFHCNVSVGLDQNPKDLKIQWICNGSRINETNLKSPNLVFMHDNTVLKINNVQKNDTGIYGCNVSNTHGYEYKEVYLLVKHNGQCPLPTNNDTVKGNDISKPCTSFWEFLKEFYWIFLIIIVLVVFIGLTIIYVKSINVDSTLYNWRGGQRQAAN